MPRLITDGAGVRLSSKLSFWRDVKKNSFDQLNMHAESRNAIVIAILTLGTVFWIGIIVLTIGRDGMILFPLVLFLLKSSHYRNSRCSQSSERD